MKYEQFRIRAGEKLKLSKRATDSTGDYHDKAEAKLDLARNVERLAELQQVLYAQNKYALLIVLQAMDAGGKDGLIRHVLSGVNPQGVSVVSFKQPSSEELDHDFLWRISKNLPERGKIGVFNRSHYEDVLVVRVHPEIIRSQPLPDEVKTDKNFWEKRFEQIRNFEKHLVENGTHVLKFFLHLSKEEQKKQFFERIDTPEKNWKFVDSDLKERGFWDDYMRAYEAAIPATSTDYAPWYVLPADKKWFTRTAASAIIREKLEAMDLQYPTVSKEQIKRLQEARKILESES
ncbi:MAG TPA: polyphosphate kinase 2 family protein [Pyrinomonadaceae bacterium]|nr:polyphosphate kinase 2 family protein [Pyrinomonadaceae bacterium]